MAWLNVAVIGGLILYIAGFMIFGPQTENDPIPQVVKIMMPLQNLTMHISPLMRHTGADLIAHRYPNRALESGHVFMVGVWLTIINILMWFGGVGRNMFYQGALARIESSHRNLTGTMKKMYPALAIMIVGFIVANNVVGIDWDFSRPLVGYHVFKGNISFYVSIIPFSASYIMMLVYWAFTCYYVFLCVINFESGLDLLL